VKQGFNGVSEEIRYSFDLDEVDWQALIAALEADQFHNGRTPAQMEQSFRNSAFVVLAFLGSECVGNTRVLSDGVCNAYVVDVWTRSDLRRRGIGRRMMKLALERLQGQHVYLFTDDQQPFYQSLGFAPQPEGMALVVGDWLQNPPAATASVAPESP
jgi:GNAT superfamily N-acetyltransferase